MPSTITHTYISLDTLNRLNKKPCKIIKEHLEDYKTFAQGMDVLYFYHILLIKNNQVQKLGHTFHHFKTNEIFRYIINYCKEHNDPIIFTFLAGLVTHYVADSTIHPYVNYLSQDNVKVKHQDKHFEIETFFDNYMVGKENKIHHNFKNYTLQFNNQKNSHVKNLIDEIFLKYFNYPNMGKKYYQALKEMRFVFKHLRYDKTGFKRNFYKLVDKNKLNVRRTVYLSYNFSLDNEEYYLNNKHRNWHNIKDITITSNKSFDELYDIVVNKASYIINQLYDYIYDNKKVNLDSLLENRSYSTGLILK